MAWTLRRLLISAFVVGHLGAVTFWIMPACAIQQRFVPYVMNYMLPIGQWQYWGMFAPDPIRDTSTLEAVVFDAQGLIHTYAFPRETGRSTWDAALHYRHSKYAANYALKEEFAAHREFGARHVIRQLGLTADAFPVDVQFIYQLRPCPPPGGPLPDPMSPTVASTIETFRFPTLEEALP